MDKIARLIGLFNHDSGQSLLEKDNSEFEPERKQQERIYHSQELCLSRFSSLDKGSHEEQ